MRFEQLRHRVERSETLVAGRAQQTRDAYGSLTSTWRESWTPTRIIVAGLVSGFIVGRTEPSRAVRKLGKLGGPRWIRMISAMSGLLTSVQSAIAATAASAAATQADDAADSAEAVADGLDDAAVDDVGVAPTADRRRPEPVWDTQPRPAEAATEISER